ncbi:MAG: hypothetical protein B6V02_01535 [Thermoprotei archaeon ex4572_64]|nr:MAG: hypothetical protein B6V02_01535 [Thermoprotei archaeon ex4572_64]
MYRVDSYEFGVIVINGVKYTRDVIILPSRIIDNWWRREGHKLYLEDLEKYGVFSEEFTHMVIGTGYHGYMKVTSEVVKELEKRGITYYIDITRKACAKFNEWLDKGYKVVGAFHLTC